MANFSGRIPKRILLSIPTLKLHAPDAIGAVIGNKKGAITIHQHIHGAATGFVGRNEKTSQKVLVVPKCTPVLERQVNHLVTRRHAAIPRAVKCHEGATTEVCGEGFAGIE